MRAPFAPPRLSEPRKVEAEAHAVETSSETERPEAIILALALETGPNIGVIDQRMIDRRDHVLPDQCLPPALRPPHVTDLGGAHVAVGELEPGAGESVGKLLGMLEEAARDLLVFRIEAQRQIGRQHGRQPLLARIERIGDRRLGILGDPLLGAGRAGGQLPLEIEEIFEEVVAPPRRRLRPGDFEARR